jgi:hypothetical protein
MAPSIELTVALVIALAAAAAHPDETIRPAPYPNRDVPAHIHATVSTACCGHQFTDLMFEGDPLATDAYRERFAAAGEYGLYGKVTRDSDGSEALSYTIRIREHGTF